MKKTALFFIVAILNFLLLCSAASAVDITHSFSKQYDRAKGGSNVYTDAFSAVSGEALLRVKNGDREDLSGASVVVLPSKSGSFLVIKLKSGTPFITISAVPETVGYGASSVLTWQSTNADSVSIDNGIGLVDLNGSVSVAPTETTTYTITATGPGGTATDTATVEVLGSAPTVTISAVPETIVSGSSAVLIWQSGGVENVYIDNGIGTVAVKDSLSVIPEHTTTYTITGSGTNGTVSSQVTVQVHGSPEPQPEGSFGTQYNDLVPPDATVDA
ncbi:MAG: hypothetical protein D3923_08230, partial [Candidatus Electrothrix sp. AR3]|nr:hypothetical protein [Candidatus Electrothrix sp. AR3]